MKRTKEIRKELKACKRDLVNLDESKFWDDIKKNMKYGGNHIKQMYDLLLKRGMKKCKILELGCGNGWASAYLAKKGCDVTATDINPHDFSGIGAIRRFKLKIKTKQMSFEEIEFPKERFDVVFMMSALHHSSRLEKVFSEVYRVLRKNSLFFILGEPMRGFLDFKNKEIEKARKEGYNDNWYFLSTCIRKARKAGFKTKVLFPLELDKFLRGQLKQNIKTKYKIKIFNILKRFYALTFFRKFIKKTYSVFTYFIGSHTILLCEKK